MNIDPTVVRNPYTYGETIKKAATTGTTQEEVEYDYVNPSHYKKGSKEVIDMMLDIWGAEKLIAHCEMCAFKYRMRLGEKPDQPIQRDLDKAKWYETTANELRKVL